MRSTHRGGMFLNYCEALQVAISRSVKPLKFFAVTVVLCGTAWIVLVVFQSQRQAANRLATKNNVKQIMLALHQYHDDHSCFPPAFVVGPDGQRWHSWRALILPYVDPELSELYRMSEPWNGPNNSTLLKRTPEVYRSACVGPPEGSTSYFAVVGKRTLWPADQALSFRDIPDGTSNTLAVVENERTDVSWLEPKDLLPHEFFHSFYDGELQETLGGQMVGLADGSARFLTNSVSRDVLMGLLTPAYLSDTYKGNDWPSDLTAPTPRQGFRSPVPVDTLQKTDLLAASSEAIDTANNQLWAASFQMVWDQLKEEVGGPVVLGNSSFTLRQLNTSSFDTAALSTDASFVAKTMVGTRQDQELVSAIQKKFPDVEPPVHQINLQPGQWGLRLYAMIRKSMPFDTVFHRFQQPLKFAGSTGAVEVNSFGQDPEDSDRIESIFPHGQVAILDDRGDDDFIVQLSTNGPQRDQIILALVPAESTLQETWNSVSKRIQQPNPLHTRHALDGNETLQIPIVDFSLQKHFSELEDQPITGFQDAAKLVLAYLDIRLRLDETGAEFLSASEAAVIGEFGGLDEEAYEPKRVRRLIFNRSFFIVMKEEGADHPWFMAWIANDELMEPFVESESL